MTLVLLCLQVSSGYFEQRDQQMLNMHRLVYVNLSVCLQCIFGKMVHFNLLVIPTQH
jgi:hypothetical protein